LTETEIANIIESKYCLAYGRVYEYFSEKGI